MYLALARLNVSIILLGLEAALAVAKAKPGHLEDKDK